MPDPRTTLKRLSRTARWTGLRLRFDRALARTFLWLPLPLIYAVGALTVIKVFRLDPDTQSTLLWVGLLPLAALVGAVLHAWFRARPRHEGALALDRHHGLQDRITTALSFHETPRSSRTPFMDAAIDDALGTATSLKPRRAAPLHIPREIPVVALLLAALVGISLLEVRVTRHLPPDKRIDPLVMSSDDLELFRDIAEELQEKNQDPEALAAARRFNQLVEDIAQRRLERREVFRRLEQLDRELLHSAEAEKESLEEGLRNIAQELEKSDLAKPVAKAFEEKNLADAEQAMKKLAERLARKQKPPTKAQLKRLREALKKASVANAQRAKRIEEQRKRVEEERQRLLKKKRTGDGGLDKRDQQQLQRLERQLERLDREKSALERAQRQLSKLDRELAKAAADLMKELDLSAQDLQSAAADINRMAQEEMSRQEKEDLRRRLQELRELIRQQGKGGKERLKRLMRFGQRARGQQGGKSGKSGKGGKPGQGGKGDPILVLSQGGGGVPIPMPGSGSGGGDTPGSGSGQGQGSGSGDQPGEGAGQGGLEAGRGHDPNLKGDKSQIEGTTHDVSAAAVDTGEGTASSEVIYGAAQRGFVGRGYRRVFTDYRTVAEQVMNRDEIPAGYRFYVQRYFQLIRPRE